MAYTYMNEEFESEGFLGVDPPYESITSADAIEAFKRHSDKKIESYELPLEAFWEAIQELAAAGEQELSEKLLQLYGKSVIDLYFDFSLPAEGHVFRCDPDLPRYGYSFEAMYAYGQYLKEKEPFNSSSAFELCLADLNIDNIDRILERWPDLLIAIKNGAFFSITSDSCLEIGLALLTGTSQIEKNEEKAFEYFFYAKDDLYTDYDDPERYCDYECDIALAACYLYGIGTVKSERDAIESLKNAGISYHGSCEGLMEKIEEMEEAMELSERTPSLVDFYKKCVESEGSI